MTAAEAQSIAILGDMVKEIARTNTESHQALTELIRDVEKRLCAKIEKRDQEMAAMMAHCRERQAEVDTLLAQRKQVFESEIAAAKLEAVRDAKAPSVLEQAGYIIGRRFWRLVVGLALIVGLMSTVLLILERLEVI